MIGVLKKQEGKTSFIPCLTIETKWPFELYHDIKLGENRAAEVRNQFEEAGTAARQDCAEVRVVDGLYTRVK